MVFERTKPAAGYKVLSIVLAAWGHSSGSYYYRNEVCVGTGSRNGLEAVWDHPQFQESRVLWVSVPCYPSVFPVAGCVVRFPRQETAQFSSSFPGSEVEVEAGVPGIGGVLGDVVRCRKTSAGREVSRV